MPIPLANGPCIGCGRRFVHCIICGSANFYSVKGLNIDVKDVNEPTGYRKDRGFRCRSCDSIFRESSQCTAPQPMAQARVAEERKEEHQNRPPDLRAIRTLLKNPAHRQVAIDLMRKHDIPFDEQTGEPSEGNSERDIVLQRIKDAREQGLDSVAQAFEKSAKERGIL